MSRVAPTLRARLVKAGFVVALRVMRRTAGGTPPLDAPEEELHEYALGLRDRVERVAGRARLGRSIRVDAQPSGPVDGLWVDASADADGAGPAGADRVTLHLHGGAYLMCSPETHRGLAAALSRVTGGPVLLPRYRLAPESPFPAAVDDALASYRWLVEDLAVAPWTIAVTGDSAGGGLALALLLAAKDAGLPLPACYVGMSPWTDLAATGGSMRDLDGVDPWLSAAMVLPAARAYAGETSLDDPLVSPLYGDLAGLPPMLIHVGTDEILLDDAVRLVDRARAAGVDASVGRFDGLWHVFQAFPLPESRRSLREIGGFVRRHTSDVVHPARTGCRAGSA